MKRCILLVAAAATLAHGQLAENANAGYRTREGRENVARTLSSPDRAERLQAETLMKLLELKPGMVVADIGTGVGAMLPFLSKAVQPGGRIYAEDIFPDFLERAKAKVETGKIPAVTFVAGTEKDPQLPEGCCDLAFTVDVYHHFDYPVEMLAGIRRALKPNGRFVIVDFYRRPDAMGNGNFALQHIRIDRDEVIKEVESSGMKLLLKQDHVPEKQYILIFGK